MGWGSRSNPKSQACKRGEIKPKPPKDPGFYRRKKQEVLAAKIAKSRKHLETFGPHPPDSNELSADSGLRVEEVETNV